MFRSTKSGMKGNDSKSSLTVQRLPSDGSVRLGGWYSTVVDVEDLSDVPSPEPGCLTLTIQQSDIQFQHKKVKMEKTERGRKRERETHTHTQTG